MTQGNPEARLIRFRPWFYAAAIYNLAWGLLNIAFPDFFFNLVGMPVPLYKPLWQVVAMFILVYAPGYWWAAHSPAKHAHIILIGLLGKLLGPIGFLWALVNGALPLSFGWTILTNDLIWLPSFIACVRELAHLRGGWRVLLSGN